MVMELCSRQGLPYRRERMQIFMVKDAGAMHLTHAPIASYNRFL